MERITFNGNPLVWDSEREPTYLTWVDIGQSSPRPFLLNKSLQHAIQTSKDALRQFVAAARQGMTE